MTPEQNAALERFFAVSGVPGPHTVSNLWRQAHRLAVRHHLRAGIALPPPLARFALTDLETRWRGYDARAERARARNQARAERIRAGVDQAIPTVSLHDRKPHELTSILARNIERDPGKFGLTKTPSLPTLRKGIKEKI